MRTSGFLIIETQRSLFPSTNLKVWISVFSSSPFSSCSSITSALHSLALRHGLAADPHIATSLLHAYSSFTFMIDALEMFDKMTHRTTVTWNAIISCCARPDWQDAGLSISCGTGIGALALCRNLHGIAARLGMLRCLGTSLVHMYARCGCWGSGWRVFDGMEERDVSALTTMIGGLAMHGWGQDAVAIFERMVQEGLVPDSVTFTSVLLACSHSGMVERGVGIFEDMKRVYGVEARMEHYGAMVDLLDRAGRRRRGWWRLCRLRRTRLFGARCFVLAC